MRACRRSATSSWTSSRTLPSPATSWPSSPTRARSIATHAGARAGDRLLGDDVRASRGAGRDGANPHLHAGQEMPLAGHPVLGTAWVLGQPLERSVIELETGMGVVPVELDRDESGALAFGRMTQPVPRLSPIARPRRSCRARCGWIRAAGRALRQRSPAHRSLRSSRLPRSQPCGQTSARSPSLASGPTASQARRSHGRRACSPRRPGQRGSCHGLGGRAAGRPSCRHGLVEWGEWIEISQGEEIGRPSTLFARAEGRTARSHACSAAAGRSSSRAASSASRAPRGTRRPSRRRCGPPRPARLRQRVARCT